jgi:hypothetical protein
VAEYMYRSYGEYVPTRACRAVDIRAGVDANPSRDAGSLLHVLVVLDRCPIDPGRGTSSDIQVLHRWPCLPREPSRRLQR